MILSQRRKKEKKVRNLNELDRYRIETRQVFDFYGSFGDHETGAFRILCAQTGGDLLVIASSGEGWDHVSVSLKHRTPNWAEMEFIKRLFFKDDETAMQLHVPPSEHISFAHTALHLWRPLKQEIPRPPNELVGAPPKDAQWRTMIPSRKGGGLG